MKLATCDLLDDALAALGLTYSDVYVLPTARGQVKRLKRQYGREVGERLSRFLSSVQIIPWDSPSDELLLFEDAFGIDGGEAIIFAATAQLDSFLVATGDKTSLRSLAADNKFRAVTIRLAGRVICLEQIIGRCIDQFGFGRVKDKVVPAVDCDQALRAIFGSGLLATKDGVLDGIDGYVADLRSSTGDLLLA
jgi:hypothetical protein